MESRASAFKAARRTKACDACHRRKIKCDGVEGNPEPCSYCVKNTLECHFTFRPNKWPPSKQYVDGIERRVEYLERRVESLKREVARLHRGGSMSGYVSSESDEFDSVSPQYDEDDNKEKSEALREMTERYEELWLSCPAGMKIAQEPRMFQGQASHVHVLNRQLAELGQESLDRAQVVLRVRPEFRAIDPHVFETVDLSLHPADWPEPDLAMLLINTFFDRFNSVYPLLHQPTFMRQFADPAMRLDPDWVTIAFAVFAVASKYVDDPRVLPTDDTGAWHGHLWHGAGTRFWKEMRRVMAPLYAPPNLVRLQALLLFVWFFSGTPLFPSVGWGLIGLGLRYVQDAGMHLKKEWAKRAVAHPFEYEMRKRVFWVLYMMERTVTLEMDRSFCLPEEDYDMDLPLELDDAALDQLQQGGPNPTGYSLSIAVFNVRMRILSFASRKRNELRAIRRLNNNADLLERERGWLQSVRSKLDQFMANLPENMRYNEEEKNDGNYLLLALGKLQYHQIQFALYRPFLSNSKRSAHSSEPILAICCGVSQSVAQTLDVMRRRNVMTGRIHEATLGAFIAGTVLLTNMWERKDFQNMEDVEKCIKAIQAIEDRWQWPGRVRDVLCNLQEIIKAALGNAQLPSQPDEESTVTTVSSSTVTNENPFLLLGLDGPQESLNEAAMPSFAPLLPDGIAAAPTETPFMPSSVADLPLFGNAAMDVEDWSFGNRPLMDSEFSQWLNAILFAPPQTDMEVPAFGPDWLETFAVPPQ